MDKVKPADIKTLHAMTGLGYKTCREALRNHKSIAAADAALLAAVMESSNRIWRHRYG